MSCPVEEQLGEFACIVNRNDHRVNLIVVGTDLEFTVSLTWHDMEIFKECGNIPADRLACKGYQLPRVILFVRCVGAQEKLIEPLPRQVAVPLGTKKLPARFLCLSCSFPGQKMRVINRPVEYSCFQACLHGLGSNLAHLQYENRAATICFVLSTLPPHVCGFGSGIKPFQRS